MELKVDGCIEELNLLQGKLKNRPNQVVLIQQELDNIRLFFEEITSLSNLVKLNGNSPRLVEEVNNRLIHLTLSEIMRNLKSLNHMLSNAGTAPNLKTQKDSLLQECYKNLNLMMVYLSNLIRVSPENESLMEELKIKNENLASAEKKYDKLINDAKSQLPKMTSANLAHAFLERSKSLSWGYSWLLGFLASIILLGCIGHDILTHLANVNNYWQFIVERSLIASPFIWSGWFSAIQFGNSIRLREDYAFKGVTAKAFVGYKDFFEDLANISTDSTKENAITALQLLSAKTIDILAREPGRFLDKSHKDASFLSVLKKDQAE